MSSPGRVSGATQQLHDNGGSPATSRPAAMGTILPPIVAPPDNMRGREGPHSASSAGRPELSRTSSVSSEQSLPKMHHILNPPSTHDKTSAPPTPEATSQPRHFPPQPLARSSTPTSSPYGPPSHRLTAPLGNPTGTIDAKKSPFLPTTNQGPPIPGGHSGPSVNPVLGPRPAQTYPQAHLPGIAGPGSRRGSDFGGNAQSRTGSPASSSISSYGLPSTTQGSPRSDYSSITQTTQHNLQHPPPYALQQSPVATAPPGMPQPHAGPQYAQHPHVQYAHHPNQPHQTILQPTGPYQLFTLDTENGPIQVPVDVQAASKMADEKRKRNAGASARFRQRRKEKERESAQTISKLESQVRELGNDMEFYRMERNYFRDLVYKHEGAKASMVARLPSPGALSERNRQTSLTSSRGDGGLSPSSAGGVDYKEIGDRASDDGRIVRQRISGYEAQTAPAQQYAQQHHPEAGSSGFSQRNHPPLQVQTHMHVSPEQHLQSQHHHHHQQQHQQQQQQQHQQPPPPPPPHQQHGHVQRNAAPPPISVQQANAQYSLPTPESRGGTPGSAPLQLNIPSALRSVSYDSANRSAPPVTYETRWAAPS